MSGIDQNIEVTFLSVLAVQHGTEHARIQTPVRCHDTTDVFTVRFKSAAT